jgi:hypothetical protein
MIPIAGVLLLIILVFSVAVVVSNPGVFELSIFGATIPVTAAGVYFTGAGAMLVLILAAALMRRGVRREMARRKQVRALQNAAGVKSLPTTSRAAKDSGGSQAADTSRAPGTPTTARTDSGTPARDGSGSATAADEGTDGSKPEAGTTLAERQALLDEAEELTGDGPDR